MILTCTLLFLMALVFVHYSIKKIIFISHKKHLFDEPSENRKIHITRTPNLGGVAMFASSLFTAALLIPPDTINHLNYVIACAVILFVMGLSDDLVALDPIKKVPFQLLVALIITLPGGFRFTSLEGIFGIYELPYALSVAASALFILLLINAFNLIDGINCLAGSVALLACAFFAYGFWKMDQQGLSMLAVTICGCLAGFLYYNRTPARIFMGDTGSLLLGFIISFFTIRFVELNKFDPVTNNEPAFRSAPALMLALLIIPVFDTLRVFTLRLFKGKSPFHADRNHIHHRLIDLKLSHMQATGVLLIVNTASLALAFLLAGLGTGIAFLALALFGMALNWVLSVKHASRRPTPKISDLLFSSDPAPSGRLTESPLTIFREEKELTQSLS